MDPSVGNLSPWMNVVHREVTARQARQYWLGPPNGPSAPIRVGWAWSPSGWELTSDDTHYLQSLGLHSLCSLLIRRPTLELKLPLVSGASLPRQLPLFDDQRLNWNYPWSLELRSHGSLPRSTTNHWTEISCNWYPLGLRRLLFGPKCDWRSDKRFSQLILPRNSASFFLSVWLAVSIHSNEELIHI